MLDDPTWINRQKNQEPPTDRAHNNGIALWHTKSHFTPISHKKKKKKRKKTGNNLDWWTWRGESDLDGIMGLESGFFLGGIFFCAHFPLRLPCVCGENMHVDWNWNWKRRRRQRGEVVYCRSRSAGGIRQFNFNKSTSKKYFLETNYWRLINKSVKNLLYKTFPLLNPSLSPLWRKQRQREIDRGERSQENGRSIRSAWKKKKKKISRFILFGTGRRSDLVVLLFQDLLFFRGKVPWVGNFTTTSWVSCFPLREKHGFELEIYTLP